MSWFFRGCAASMIARLIMVDGVPEHIAIPVVGLTLLLGEIASWREAWVKSRECAASVRVDGDKAC